MKENAASRASAMRWPGGVTPARRFVNGAVHAHSASRNTRIEIDALGDEARGFRDQIVEPRLLFGLHQAEMPLRQRDRRMPRQRAEHGDAGSSPSRGARDPRAAGLRCD